MGQEGEFVEPYLPIGEYGPYPERLRQQFEGVIWRFRTGGQWREMPLEPGAWSTVHNRFRQWRDAGAFEALLEGLIAQAAKRGAVNLSLVSIDSTTARSPRRSRNASGRGRPRRPGEGRHRGGEGQVKRGSLEEQDGQNTETDPGREERGTHSESAKTPAEGRLPGTLQGRVDQQGPPRRRPQVPPAGVRADRRPGRRTARGSSPCSRSCGPEAHRAPATRWLWPVGSSTIRRSGNGPAGSGETPLPGPLPALPPLPKSVVRTGEHRQVSAERDPLEPPRHAIAHTQRR
ncbi:transposase [Streptomyces sp. NPDC055134]